MTSREVAERPRILVAEDDAALRRLLELRLTVDGYEVRSVGDGADALALVDIWAPAILLCDVMMPKVSGLSVCRELRARPEFADLPIVLLTARVFDEDIEAIMQLGGITFMNKPFNAEQLNRTLASILGTPPKASVPAPEVAGPMQWLAPAEIRAAAPLPTASSARPPTDR